VRYVAYHELGRTANIIVDGSGNTATRLTLSHWPKSGTPAALKADTSAEIVFRYLDRPDLHVDAEAASNNHFDEDGLVGLYTLLNPEPARRKRGLLSAVASAGDFGTFSDRNAARAAFAISAYTDPRSSPLDPAVFHRPYAEQAAAFYAELLPRLPEILDDLESYRRYWEAEDEVLAAGEDAIRSGEIRIEELPAIDLAIVTVPEVLPERAVHRFASGRHAACHPMAIHNATRCFRILSMQGRRYELQYRYESWVQYVSRRPLPRVDLAPLAERLTSAEDGVRWVFEGVDAITPRLRLDGFPSGLARERIRDEVVTFLGSAQPAWDPYD